MEKETIKNKRGKRKDINNEGEEDKDIEWEQGGRRQIINWGKGEKQEMKRRQQMDAV